MMTGKLKPCPFCGNESPHITSEADHPEWGSGGRFYYVKCGKCRAQSGAKYASAGNDCPIFYEEVRSEWNQRAPAGVVVPPKQKVLNNGVVGFDEGYNAAIDDVIEANKKEGE